MAKKKRDTKKWIYLRRKIKWTHNDLKNVVGYDGSLKGNKTKALTSLQPITQRTAKQKAASKRNLEKARAAKKRGGGIATKGYADVRSEIKRRKHWRKRSWM